MSEIQNLVDAGMRRKLHSRFNFIKSKFSSLQAFRLCIRALGIFALLSIPYWAFIASDKYVSDAIVLVQRTDQPAGSTSTVSSGTAAMAGITTPSSSDQLVLSQYLLSVDMLEKLDAAFDLRGHYGNSGRDPLSRMWFKNEPIDWFYRYWLSRVSVVYDEYNGVLDIEVEAYDPAMAKRIVDFMIAEGQAHMNLLGHQLAQSQVDFLTKQVDANHEKFIAATKAMVDFQNKQGLTSPLVTAESINTLIASLETQKAEIQTQLGSLPPSLSANQPMVLTLRSRLATIDAQIRQKRAELASPSSRTLNYSVEEFQALQLQVGFAQDLYKSALMTLEQGREDSVRMLKMVSILQSPTLAAYPMKPQRFYNILTTLIVVGLFIGVLKLMESIIRDHVD
jgi:capsular polysaccharide transport system permease protein